MVIRLRSCMITSTPPTGFHHCPLDLTGLPRRPTYCVRRCLGVLSSLRRHGARFPPRARMLGAVQRALLPLLSPASEPLLVSYYRIIVQVKPWCSPPSFRLPPEVLSSFTLETAASRFRMTTDLSKFLWFAEMVHQLWWIAVSWRCFIAPRTVQPTTTSSNTAFNRC